MWVLNQLREIFFMALYVVLVVFALFLVVALLGAVHPCLGSVALTLIMVGYIVYCFRR